MKILLTNDNGELIDVWSIDKAELFELQGQENISPGNSVAIMLSELLTTLLNYDGGENDKL